MIRLFLDTNVVLDLLERREPWVYDVEVIFQLAVEKRVELLVSDLTFINIAYIARKSFPKDKIFDALVYLRRFVGVIGIGQEVIDRVLASRHVDFEDSAQYFAAQREGMDYIITRDRKGFEFLDIESLTPKELLDRFL